VYRVKAIHSYNGNALLEYLVILAGGKGTRLAMTESLPKPFIDINGKPLVQRVIEQVCYINEFKNIVLLTCADNYNAKEMLNHHDIGIRPIICEEARSSGRLGAVKNFYEQFTVADRCIFMNGDTLLRNVEVLKRCFESCQNIVSPIVYLANSDPSRSDYKKVMFELEGVVEYYQNSGIFIATRKWIEDIWQDEWVNSRVPDIDELLFDEKSDVVYEFLDTEIMDIGTPERVAAARAALQ